MAADPASLRTVADLLDEDDIYDIAADAITEARDSAPRAPGDRDSGEVLNHLIEVLRARADSAT
jgi:hypothetical protein